MVGNPKRCGMGHVFYFRRYCESNFNSCLVYTMTCCGQHVIKSLLHALQPVRRDGILSSPLREIRTWAHEAEACGSRKLFRLRYYANDSNKYTVKRLDGLYFSTVSSSGTDKMTVARKNNLSQYFCRAPHRRKRSSIVL